MPQSKARRRANNQAKKEKQKQRKEETKARLQQEAERRAAERQQLLVAGRVAIDRDAPQWKIPVVAVPSADAPEAEVFQHFDERAATIPDMSIEQLQMFIWQLCHAPKASKLFRPVTKACLDKILRLQHPGASPPRQAKDSQIDAVMSAVFGKADTILIARTGEGKSLVFQAFTLMTGMITIQIIPLNRLGQEQAEAVSRLDTGGMVNVINVTAESKQLDPDIYKHIQEGRYQHILLGPEQASHPKFRALLRKPEVRNRIGAVVIDEIHLVKKWGEKFRKTYTHIWELRDILRKDTIWIGASATVSAETLEFVLKYAGFRPVANKMYHTKIIRASIDRSDTTYVFRRIPQGKNQDYSLLYFLTKNAVNAEGEATPQRIKKALTFIDGRTHIQTAMRIMRRWLVHLTKDCVDISKRYHNGGQRAQGFNPALDVQKIVSIYTSKVAKHDQNKRYDQYCKPDSQIRILFATTSMSTGTNVPDIELVVQWGFPITWDLEDVMQRLGRVGRDLAAGVRSTAILFLPEWVDDLIKAMPDGVNEPWIKPPDHLIPEDQRDAPADSSQQPEPMEEDVAPEPEEPARINRPRRAGSATLGRWSHLRQSQIPGEDSGGISDQEGGDAEDDSDSDEDDDNEEDPGERGDTPFDAAQSSAAVRGSRSRGRGGRARRQQRKKAKKAKKTKRKFFSKEDIKRRKKLNKIWLELWNSWLLSGGQGPCPRMVINTYLGEDECLYPHTPAAKHDCCNICNPDLPILADLDMRPPEEEVPKVPSKPRVDQIQYYALPLIKRWLSKEMEFRGWFSNNNKLFEFIPSNLLLPEHTAYQICDVYKGADADPDGWTGLTEAELLETAPLLQDWQHKDQCMTGLVRRMNLIVPDVIKEFKEYQEAAAKKAAEKQKAKEAAAAPQEAPERPVQLSREQRLANLQSSIAHEAGSEAMRLQVANANRSQSTSLLQQATARARTQANTQAGRQASQRTIQPQSSQGSLRPARSFGSLNAIMADPVAESSSAAARRQREESSEPRGRSQQRTRMASPEPPTLAAIEAAIAERSMNEANAGVRRSSRGVRLTDRAREAGVTLGTSPVGSRASSRASSRAGSQRRG